MKTTAWILLALGAIVAGIGIFLGVSQVTRYATNCGTGFGGVSDNALTLDLSQAAQADAAGITFDDPNQTQHACDSAVSDRKTLTWLVVAPGAALLCIGGGLSLAARRPQHTAAPAVA